jgi:3-hydroxy-9,10-secoandrosta-1,3,5(10)-triene-9,17-dione monooxygenase
MEGFFMTNELLKTEGVSVEQLLAGAERIGQLAEQEAQDAEQNRTISKNVVQLIKETQISRMLLPKKYGGPQIDLKTFAQIIQKVSYHNISAGWLTYLYPLHNALPSYLPEKGMDEIAMSQGLIVDVFFPVGKAEKDGDGFRISGKWHFASGVLHSEWIGLGLIMELGEGPEYCLPLLKTSEVEILDNWDALGLRGSGSNSVIADNVYVPVERILRLEKVAIELKHPPFEDYDKDYLFYHKPFFSTFYIGFQNIALGGAKRLLEEFKARTEKRFRLGGTPEKGSPGSQRVISELTMKYKQAELLINHYIDLLENYDNENPTSPEEFFAIRATAIKHCTDIASRVLLTLGGAALSKGDIVEVMTRDVLAVATHITALYEDAMTDYGKNLFGYATTRNG